METMPVTSRLNTKGMTVMRRAFSHTWPRLSTTPKAPVSQAACDPCARAPDDDAGDQGGDDEKAQRGEEGGDAGLAHALALAPLGASRAPNFCRSLTVHVVAGRTLIAHGALGRRKELNHVPSEQTRPADRQPAALQGPAVASPVVTRQTGPGDPGL
jgi:hypothetical protein